MQGIVAELWIDLQG